MENAEFDPAKVVAGDVEGMVYLTTNTRDLYCSPNPIIKDSTFIYTYKLLTCMRPLLSSQTNSHILITTVLATYHIRYLLRKNTIILLIMQRLSCLMHFCFDYTQVIKIHLSMVLYPMMAYLKAKSM